MIDIMGLNKRRGRSALETADSGTVNSVSDEHLEYLRKLKFGRNMVLFTQALIFVGFFALWETAARMKWIDPFIFSQPSRILRTLASMAADGSIFLHIWITLGETVAGFMVSTVAGTAIAVVLWWNDFFKKALSPYLVVLNSIPKTALAPIIIVWIGNNKNSVIATAVMTSIIVTVMSVMTGFMEVNRDKLKLVRTFGGTKRQEFFKVVLPASVPTIINALKINIGLSFVGVIVGEFLVAEAGLGYLIVYGSQVFKMDWVMMSIIILGVLSAVMYQCVVAIEKRVTR